jgi:hypothetical protein
LTSQGNAAPPTWTTAGGAQNLASVLAVAPAGVALPSQNITLSTSASPSYLGGKITELNTSDGDISMNGYVSATKRTYTQLGTNFLSTGEVNGSAQKSLDANGDGLRIDGGGRTIIVDNIASVIDVKVGTSTSGQLSATSMVVDDLGNNLKSTVNRDSLTITDYSATPINTSYGRTNIQCDSSFSITTADDIILTPGSQLISTPLSTTFVIGQEGIGTFGYYANNTVGVGSDTNYAVMYGFPASSRNYIEQNTSDGKNALFTLEGASPHYKIEASVPINFVSSSVLVNSDPTDTKEYSPNSEFGTALIVYNDVGVVPLVSQGKAEVIFQNKSATAQSSNIIAICDKDGDYMTLGQVSGTAVGSTLFDVRGAGYTSSSGHNIVGTSTANSTVITYASGNSGLQVNSSGAIGFDATPLVTAGVVSLQNATFGDVGQMLISNGALAPPSWETPVIPNLQQVCDVGSTTDTGITVQVGTDNSTLTETKLGFVSGDISTVGSTLDLDNSTSALTFYKKNVTTDKLATFKINSTNFVDNLTNQQSEFTGESLRFEDATTTTSYSIGSLETTDYTIDSSGTLTIQADNVTIDSPDINIGTTDISGSVITAGWYTDASNFSQTNFHGQA